MRESASRPSIAVITRCTSRSSRSMLEMSVSSWSSTTRIEYPDGSTLIRLRAMRNQYGLVGFSSNQRLRQTNPDGPFRNFRSQLSSFDRRNFIVGRYDREEHAGAGYHDVLEHRIGQQMAAKSGTVLVTGGAGFIGSHLVDALIRNGLRVRILDNLSTGTRRNLNPDAELIEADLRDLDSIRPAFRDIDTVFHAAALARVPLSIERPIETHTVNALGTLNVLMAAREAGVRRFVYSGSSSVYGNQPALPLREEMKPSPLNPYALQKLVGEQYCRLFHQLYGMQTLTLRYFNVFGPRMTTVGAYVTVIAV